MLTDSNVIISKYYEMQSNKVILLTICKNVLYEKMFL